MAIDPQEAQAAHAVRAMLSSFGLCNVAPPPEPPITCFVPMRCPPAPDAELPPPTRFRGRYWGRFARGLLAIAG